MLSQKLSNIYNAMTRIFLGHKFQNSFQLTPLLAMIQQFTVRSLELFGIFQILRAVF